MMVGVAGRVVEWIPPTDQTEEIEKQTIQCPPACSQPWRLVRVDKVRSRSRSMGHRYQGTRKLFRISSMGGYFILAFTTCNFGRTLKYKTPRFNEWVIYTSVSAGYIMQYEVRNTIKATPGQIFAVYEDVAGWPKWDPEIVSSSLVGAFKAGSAGKLKPTSGPNGKIYIIEVTENESFTATSKLPLCTMSFAHRLIPKDDETEVVHIVSFTGMLSPLFLRLIGPSHLKSMGTQVVHRFGLMHLSGLEERYIETETELRMLRCRLTCHSRS